MFKTFTLGWLAIGCLGAPPSSSRGEPPRYDVVLTGGRIVDGTGNPWFRGDVAILGDRIAAVGVLPEGYETERTIDAAGKVVCPGFIDIHSHSDRVFFLDGRAEGKIRQGVTTEILGEHSSGGPNTGLKPPETVEIDGEAIEIRTLGDYFEALERAGIGVNAASYVGLGNLLECVLGQEHGRPNETQFEELETLIHEAMNDGAIGLSTMVAHPQELELTTEDLIRLARAVAPSDGIYSTHIRNEGTEVFEAIREAIRIGEQAGVPVDIIHIKIADERLWGRMNEIVALIDAARERGVNVQANVYPYTRGNNNLVSIIPPWAHEGGTEALLDRLRDPDTRERVKRDIRSGLPGWYNHYLAVGGDWSRMLISGRLSPENAEFEGKTMDEVLERLAAGRDPRPDPLDLLCELLIAEGGSVGTIYAHHTEEDMNRAMLQPWCSIGSDGSALAVEGPLRTGHPHPRNFGTFPRVLGRYVRERGLLRLEQAIRKMTSENAAKVGLLDRGLLRPGLFADVTVFDPETVIDTSTYLEPFQYPRGIEFVLVNGVLVLDAGEPNGALPGRALRRPGG